MLLISRRTFLVLSGASLVASSLPFGAVDSAPQESAARALQAAPVYRRPRLTAPVSGYIWPDSVADICGYDSEWFAVPGGYVQHEVLQPIEPFDPANMIPIEDAPAWVSVAAPVAPVREWVGADAPLVTRVGYGGVLCALDHVIDQEGRGWYAVGTGPQADLLGWTPSLRWNAVDSAPTVATQTDRRLLLDTSARELVATQDGREILRAPLLAPNAVSAGTATLEGRTPSLNSAASGHFGACWALHFGGGVLYGAYWHNKFGSTTATPGWEVAPWMARWLYGWLPPDAQVIIT